MYENIVQKDMNKFKEKHIISIQYVECWTPIGRVEGERAEGALDLPPPFKNWWFRKENREIYR